ncbi:hypothetical protein [uncultured Microscilla sp.]|uniref:hypothetical protein n=1 Tax=uncultured Microscilla sp. TaxID=432653 RepID=UPI00260206D6|nr:hypothetical protein [uncultured Microscilla sp.]
MKNHLELYNKYYVDRQFEKVDLFELLADKYQIKVVLYPGSFVHITPSFIIPKAYYVDADKAAKKFFAHKEEVMELISKNKTYSEDIVLEFFGQDYFKPINIKEGSVDLLVSQYAGPISQACKKYLKKGGHLLVNNSHADAGIAALDPDFQLVGVVKSSKGKHRIDERALDEYFCPKKDLDLSIDYLLKLGKGVGYTKTADSYVFEKCGA